MNIRASNITKTSFVVQWDEVDDADGYSVKWRVNGDKNGNDGKSGVSTSNTSHTIRELTPNTSYSVTVTAKNGCGNSNISNSLLVTTNMTILVTSGGDSDSKTDGTNGSSGGGAGGIIGGIVGGIIAVAVLIIIVVVLYWFCVYKKKGMV